MLYIFSFGGFFFEIEEFFDSVSIWHWKKRFLVFWLTFYTIFNEKKNFLRWKEVKFS